LAAGERRQALAPRQASGRNPGLLSMPATAALSDARAWSRSLRPAAEEKIPPVQCQRSESSSSPPLRASGAAAAVPGLPAAQEQQYHELGYTVLRGVIEESELRC